MADAQIRAVITAEDRASRVVQGFGTNLGKAGAFVSQWGKRAAVAAGAATVAFATLGVKTAAQLESARQGFITLLGSAQKADKTMNRIKQEAARTPFEIAGLTSAVQMMTAITKDGDKAVDVVLDVGEALAAMGRGQEELDRIAVNLQQIGATGRATAIDIKQFAFAGIPIFDMLKKETGLAGEALDNFISSGKVTFEMLSTMFDRANDKGGRFFNAFKNQLGTFNQSWSNLKDTLSVTAADIITQIGLFDGLKKAMAGVGGWIVANKGGIISFFNTLKTIGGGAVNAVRSAFNQLRGSLAAAGNTIRGNLGPQVVKLWHNIKPLVPIVGAALVGALRVAINTFNQIASAIGVVIGMVNTAINAIKSLVGWISRIPIIGGLIRGIGGAINSIRGKQLGGPVTAGKPYMVGEAGPELVIPRNNATVVPNHQLGGGGQINFSVNIGMFAGTPMERRTIAKRLFKDFQDAASQMGTTPSALLDGKIRM